MVASSPKETSSASTAISAGAAAWVRRQQHSQSSASLWWPCLVYPSWKYASLYSGWMTEDVQQVRIEGCKKPVAVSHLAKNIVPQKAALRPLPQQTSPQSPFSPHPKQHHKDQKRNVNLLQRPPHRLVAYYLGLDEDDDGRMAHWAAVKVETLQPYRANALEMVRSHHPKLARLDRIQWTRAMDEMATALDDPSLSFHNLSEELRAEDATLVMGQTPEFFDDWQPSGTYGASQSQSQRFTQFSQGGLGALLAPRPPGIPAEEDGIIKDDNVPTANIEVQQQDAMMKTPTQAKPGEDPNKSHDKKAGEDIIMDAAHHNGEHSPSPLPTNETDALDGGGPTPPIRVIVPPQSAAKEVVRLASVTPSPHPLSTNTAPHWNSHMHDTPSTTTKCGDNTSTNMEVDDDDAAAGVKRLFADHNPASQHDAPDDPNVEHYSSDEGRQEVAFQPNAQAPIMESKHNAAESIHAPNGTEPQNAFKEPKESANTILSNDDMEEVPSSQDDCGAFYTQQL
eukprot:scaffold45377_cov50-Attheya_sp.AAC.3